jgi:hypothetical protein
VSIYTDFDVETDSIDGMRVVLDMNKEGLVSREATITEAKRRNILSPEYDEEKDLDLILADLPDDEAEITAALPPAPAD